MGTRLILVVAGLLIISSCSRKITTTQTIVKDSVYVKEVPRLIEVRLPGDTVTIIDYIECDSIKHTPKPKKIQARHGKAFTSVEVKANGTLTATGGCDSLTAVIQAMDKEIFKLRHEQTKTVETKIVRKPTQFDIFLRWGFGIIVLVIGGRALLKIKGLI
jgi:hypothetical protein